MIYAQNTHVQNWHRYYLRVIKQDASLNKKKVYESC